MNNKKLDKLKLQKKLQDKNISPYLQEIEEWDDNTINVVEKWLKKVESERYPVPTGALKFLQKRMVCHYCDEEFATDVCISCGKYICNNCAILESTCEDCAY